MGIRNLSFSTAFRLKAVPPYDFSLTVRKPAGWSLLTPFEIFESGTLWTAMGTPLRKMFGLKLRALGTVQKPEFSCEVYSHKKLGVRERKELKNTLTWMLNLEEDIRQFHALAERDPLVKALVKDLYGMRTTKRPDIFPRLILAVTLQMAPIRRSSQMMNLLIKEYGEKIGFDGKEILYWPSPERIAKADVRELEERCKLGYRAKSLKDIAESVSKGFPTIQQLERMSAEEAKAKLMELKGIGEYSADIVSPHPGFALDVWSAKIFSVLLFGEKAESPRGIIPNLKKAAEERWGRWRGYVFTYVLNDLDNLSRKYNFDLTEL
ncbi:MAG: DNA-3-methyladenine glycosylase family protein [Candidatus Bathyarchaeia archaeon]